MNIILDTRHVIRSLELKECQVSHFFSKNDNCLNLESTKMSDKAQFLIEI